MGRFEEICDKISDYMEKSVNDVSRKNEEYYRKNREMLERNPEAMAKYNERTNSIEKAKAEFYAGKARRDAIRNGTNLNDDYDEY